MTGLRVGLVAGSLTQGGAERQLVYLADALRAAGATVRVFALTRDEHFEPVLRSTGTDVTWVGRHRHPAGRLLTLRGHLARFRPHVLQSTHFFSNLYVACLARGRRCLGIGALRNDVHFEVTANGAWGPWLLRLPPVLLANSEAARRNAIQLGRAASQVFVLPNAIDIADFDRRAAADAHLPRRRGDVVVTMVCRLVWQKRVDTFLEALARALQSDQRLRALVVGDGPERAALEAHAAALRLGDHVTFVGRRDDVPAVLRASDLLVLCSEHEGTPNAILEAMAAGVPIVTTEAGGAGDLVRAAGAGCVLQARSTVDSLADALVQVAASGEARDRWGRAGRAYVAATHDLDALGPRAIALYREMANVRRVDVVARCLAA